jgi:uncharacterized protein (TIRG00374 family)
MAENDGVAQHSNPARPPDSAGAPGSVSQEAAAQEAAAAEAAAAGPVVSAAPTTSARRLGLRLAFSLAIGAFFVWVMQQGAMPLLPDDAAFRRVEWWTFAAYLVGWSIVHVLRAIRWKLLLEPLAEVNLRRVLVASFVGFLAIVVLPLRAGEVVRPLMIRERGRLSAWAAVGTLGAERIVDGLILSVILFLALQLSTPLDPLPDRIGDLPISVAVVPRAAYLALIVFAAALVSMSAFYVWKGWTRRWIERLIGTFSRPLANWGAARIEKVADGLRFLSNWRQAVPFFGVTLLYWLLNAACNWLLGWGVGFEHFSYAEACVVTGVLALGVLMPNAPGFFGAFQFALYAALAVFYARERVLSEGAAFVFLVYVAQTSITVAFALWGLLAGGRESLRRISPWGPGPSAG